MKTVIKNTGNNSDNAFEGLLKIYLQRRQENKGEHQAHLDEDAAAAFVEGTLTHKEAAPILQHLVSCTSCRKVTSELAALSSELEEIPLSTPFEAEKTNRLQLFLKNTVLPTLGLTDDAVFAHNAANSSSDVEENEADNEKPIDPTSETEK